MSVKKNKFEEYNIFSGALDSISFKSKTVIDTINQYSFCIAEKDPLFKRALVNADILLPDGIGIVMAVKAASHQVIKKITGTDLHSYLIKELNTTNGTCFYLGSTEQTLEKINQHISQEYPNVKAGYFSPRFAAEFSDKDNEEMIAKINSYNPDVLFVGMTAPKQEKWVDEHKYKINAKIICSIGAVFDFYAGTIKRPDKVWINLGLEWFVRLYNEPKRMWKRYLYYGPIFMFTVFKEMVKTDLAIITSTKQKRFNT